MNNQLRWHYTVGVLFDKILQSGEIRPATAFVPKNEKPAVWFSSNPVWEPTANKSATRPDGSIVHLDMKGTVIIGKGLVRIAVLPQIAPHDWKAFKKLSGVTAKMAEGLYNRAKEQNARPGEWYTTFAPVSRSNWIAVEVWDGVDPAGWKPHPCQAC